MEIDLNAIDQTQFMVHSHTLNGEIVYLVQPNHIGAKFTQANKHLRSSVWNEAGEIVSAGFPKFTNWGENPENFPVPKSLKNCHVVEKVDGSLLIVSKYKRNYILRTRGTVDATKLDNGHELELFKEKYLPKLQEWNLDDTWDCSYLFEWVSPCQRIILNYGDQPEWYLVGNVIHDAYNLLSQQGLDNFAKIIGCPRPPSYTFPDIDTLMKDVETWKGKEGVVVYSSVGMHKVKGLWYLALHRMKESLASREKVVDAWFEHKCPSFHEFEQFITNQFDYELWVQIRPEVSTICDSWKEVQQIVEGMKSFVNNMLLPLPARKDQALKVIESYGKTNRASFVFKILDQKPLDSDDLKKLLYQCLK